MAGRLRYLPRAVLALALLLLPGLAWGQFGGEGIEALTVTTDGEGGETYSVTLQILLLMTLLTLLPAALIMMTAFTRILVVLAILRQGLGTTQTPSNQILIGLAFFLTLFVMAPVFDEIYESAVVPYMNEEMGPKKSCRPVCSPFASSCSRTPARAISACLPRSTASTDSMTLMTSRCACWCRLS